MRVWWCRRYKLPPTDERFYEYTIPELILELYEDIVINREIEKEITGHQETPPISKEFINILKEKKKKVKVGDEEVVFYEVGDEFIDTWEKYYQEQVKKYAEEKGLEVVEELVFDNKSKEK